MLERFLNQLPAKPLTYAPFPPAANREGWAGLSPETAAALISRGEKHLDFAWPAISMSDWLLFTQNGNRADFEAKYLSRRRALCALILAECAEHKGRFLNDITNGIWLLCEESAWQLPAHNSYSRGGTVLPLPDTGRPILDLFSCETGALLATALYLLRSELDSVSPVITQRIERELRERVLLPYLEGAFWWMGGIDDGSTNNWTVWCTQNILLTAFLAPASNGERLAVIRKSAQSINHFLGDYGDDGCCDEGAGYYRHAGLCLFGALEVLDRVSGGAFADIWQQTKIKNIARYILNVHVDDKYYINFADCSAIAARAVVREYLFGLRCGDDDLCDFAASEWRKTQERDLPDEYNLFYRLQAAFFGDELSARPIPDTISHSEIYYPSAGLFIARDDIYCLAVKAGGNDDSHNHNDTGSIILYKNGEPFLIDIGVESYTAKTFSPQHRYEIWTMQSSWHNLPEFNGVMQNAGAQYRAENVQVAFEQDKSFIAMRLDKAWPSESGLAKFSRTVTLFKGRGIRLEDNAYAPPANPVLNLIFCRKPELRANVIYLPELGEISANGMLDAYIEAVPISDPRLRLVWPDTLYRVRITFDKAITLDIK